MRKEKVTDYNTYYASILSIEKDQGKINASNFLSYISELIIKNSETIEMKVLSGRVIINEKK
ncbi:hypothetical protein [Niallia sp. FSL W8-0635]|uniref:hypothetical protein n=1 Tax=Niallia sp. FSL W8-0635 TaxID=2975337 RepID=UPI0009CDAFDF|nr:Uncharacterised protein [Mycobacteroides abscessus subsp. abscessus]HEO8420299.1 hypothetical protein [Yersinia enterocolitica]